MSDVWPHQQKQWLLGHHLSHLSSLLSFLKTIPKKQQEQVAQDIRMVWMCCGVVHILFGWFLMVPSLHALVFSWKTFCDF